MLKVFRTRVDAGRQLAALIQARGFDRPVLLGISQGGVQVAAEMVRRLDGEIGFIAANPDDFPTGLELTIGQLSHRNASQIYRMLLGTSTSVRECDETEHAIREVHYLRPSVVFDDGFQDLLAGRPVIVVDDLTTRPEVVIATIRSIQVTEASMAIFAAPAAAGIAMESIRRVADRVICIHEVPCVNDVIASYIDFQSIGEEEWMSALDDVLADRGRPCVPGCC